MQKVVLQFWSLQLEPMFVKANKCIISTSITVYGSEE